MRNLWQLWNKALSPEECKELIDIGYSEGEFSDATVFSDSEYKPDSGIRDTKVAFINNDRVNTIMNDYLLTANRNAFNYDVDYLPSAQFGEYSEGSFYNYHHDIDWQSDSMYDRKLSICVQLTDPSEYTGGIFEFQHIESPTDFINQGSILVFPSHQVHRITKLEKGIRNSLVGWMEGPRWR